MNFHTSLGLARPSANWDILCVVVSGCHHMHVEGAKGSRVISFDYITIPATFPLSLSLPLLRAQQYIAPLIHYSGFFGRNYIFRFIAYLL